MYRVEFRKDGRATRTRYGNPFRREKNRVDLSMVGQQAFAALVATVRDQGFFDLDDRYPPSGMDRVQDGAWSTTRVSRDGTTKTVINMNKEGPSRLTAIEDAIDELARRATWVPHQE